MSINSNQQALLRDLPSVDRLIQAEEAQTLISSYGRSLTVEGFRYSLETTRAAIVNGRVQTTPPSTQIFAETANWLHALLAPTLQPVINGTGVIVHTNLGRAPLSQEAIDAIQQTAVGYATLEYDVASGKRGSRTIHAEQLIRRLTQADAALVVNNNAAAVLLMLTAVCQGKEVIISRGQLVEIGGGFRIPDVMAQSGATLVEVGTTNRTHLHDYENAINENTGAILVAHHSNYKIIGFSSEPSLAELATLAKRQQIPLLYDQGSGAILDTAPYGIEPEPTVLDGLDAGCDLVAFSGDKLLGGPQAGILVGQKDLVQKCKKHPLARAIRADKLCLAGLAATLNHYLTEEAITKVPVWQMIAKPITEIEQTAHALAQSLQKAGIKAELVNGRSTVGGGSLPGTSLPSRLLAIETNQADQLAKALRAEKPAVIGRIQDGRFLIDPRTILPQQVELLRQSLLNCA